jgi:hypothetical protein
VGNAPHFFAAEAGIWRLRHLLTRLLTLLLTHTSLVLDVLSPWSAASGGNHGSVWEQGGILHIIIEDQPLVRVPVRPPSILHVYVFVVRTRRPATNMRVDDT